ncbi:MAG: M6 family metalloprotease domain-containing protein [Gemmatimonadales bacterium]
MLPRNLSTPTWFRPVHRAGIALVLLLATVAPASQSVPVFPRSVPGRFEVTGLDFRPTGAWRQRTEAIRGARRGLLRGGLLSRLNRGFPALRVQGNYHVPVIPITFPAIPAPFPSASYAGVLFNAGGPGQPYSIRSYYAEVSRGAIDIDGVVFGWVIADSADTYYEDGCNGVGVITSCPHGGRRFGDLLLEAVSRSDTGTVDWGQFDNDGADGLPNSGDDDGVVDFVTFLQPEVDGACGTTNLWAHRYDLAAWNGGSAYVTITPRRDGTGQPMPGRFIQIRDYTLQSAVGGPSACTDGVIMPIGTMAHETGHAFGLPDLYDTNLGNAGVTQGIGEWGLMGSGNYAQPYSPAGYDAWSLVELGWAQVDTLRTNASITLGPVQLGDTVLYAAVPGTDEYFLFENRQARGSDSAQLNPGCLFGTRSCAKSPGLLIWHIDSGQVLAHGFRRDNRVNSGPVHGVALIQADGLNQLRTPGLKNRGDPGDSWPGASGNTFFGPTTNPAALDNRGASAGFFLDSIRQVAPGGAVAFRFTTLTPGQIFVTLPWAAGQVLGEGTLGSAQTIHLDSLGNRNGSFDVGDFLAYYRSIAPDVRRGTP